MENDFLICGAFEGEIDLIKIKFPVNTLETGVGLVDSTISLTEKVVKHKPKIIIQVGSCGNLSGCEVGSIIRSKSFRLFETGLKDKKVHIPDRMNIELSPTFQDHPWKNLKPAIVITSLGVSLFKHEEFDEPSVETMESFGLAKVANIFSIPFISILGVTNHVGPEGSTEWRKNWNEISHKVQSLVLESIRDISRNSSA
jgi:nucleoside phosphorylase